MKKEVEKRNFILIVSIIILIILAVCVFLFWDNITGKAIGEEGVNYINSCQIINKPGIYVLTNDINYTNQSNVFCIYLPSDDIILDGNGYFIYFDWGSKNFTYNPPTIGILVYNQTYTVKNITIKNFNIGGFTYGIDFSNVRDSLITNNTLFSGSSISLADSSNVLILDNTINDAAGSAMSITGAYLNNIIHNNIWNSKGSGIWFYRNNTGNNKVFNNTICGSSSSDISCYGKIGENNILLNNKFDLIRCSSLSDPYRTPCTFSLTCGKIYNNKWGKSQCKIDKCVNSTYFKCEIKKKGKVKYYREVCFKDKREISCSQAPKCDNGYSEINRVTC